MAEELTQPKTLLYLGLGWAGAVVSGLIGFAVAWGRLPGIVDIAMSLTLLAPFALPKSLGDLIGLTSGSSTDGTVPLAIGFWLVMTGLHWFVLAKRSRAGLVVLIGLLLAAGFNWFRVGAGMAAL